MTGLLCPRCEGAFEGLETCPRCVGGDAVHLVQANALRQTPEGARYLLGRVLDGRFRVDGYLGGGGMSLVYLATQLSVERRVALKVIRASILNVPGAETRFVREARIVAQLSHPNIAQVFDFGQTRLSETSPPLHYIAMEYVPGTTLAATIRRGALEIGRVREIAQAILSALEGAHGAGIVHRDLKPENVVIAPDGRVRLLDFGIAKMLEGAATKLTATGMNPGTPQYMPPEQWLGGDIGPHTDLYAFGCILFEMLTGRTPYDADTPIGFAPLHTRAPIPPIQRPDGEPVPEDLAALTRQCLAKKPGRRPPNASAARASIAGGAPLPLPLSRGGPVLAASLATIAVGVLVAVWFMRQPEPQPLPPRAPVAVAPILDAAPVAQAADAAVPDASPPDMIMADAARPPQPPKRSARRPAKRPLNRPVPAAPVQVEEL